MESLKIMLSVAALAAALSAGTSVFADDADAGTIRHLMMAQFDRPDSRLTVEPVTIQGDIAVTGWAQGDTGGHALLRGKGDGWVLTLCSGDALKEARSLQNFGLNVDEADAMAKAIIETEAKLDPTLVAKFSTFDGVMMMDEGGHHPPVVGHGGNHGG